AIHDVDMFLGIYIRKIDGSNFPIEGYTEKQKGYFLNQVELDYVLANYFLKEISNSSDRRDAAVMLWAGGLVGAKGTRKTYVTSEEEKEYSPTDRENDFKIAEEYAIKNEILQTCVEAAVVLELLVKKIPMISLKRLNPNPDSPLLRHIRDKGEEEISVNDLIIDVAPYKSGQQAQYSWVELFIRIFDKLSGNGNQDVAAKDLINALVETGKFDKIKAELRIQMAMNQGIIFERKAGFYAKT
ncbi:MAG: hypothetical protein ACRD8Z_18065, partial [Nitrososphaeraceae archaeon]